MKEPEYWDMQIKRSVSRLFLLAVLAKRPMHGYEIAREMREACQGCCDPTDAMIYPALRELQENGLVECRPERVGGRERKVCALTEEGLDSFRLAARAWGRVIPYLAQAVEAAGVEGQEAITQGGIREGG
jgi:DNA-binding PadR family transcriptional regulator